MSKLIGFVILVVLIGTSVAAGPRWGHKSQMASVTTLSPDAMHRTISAAALPVQPFEDMSVIFVSP